jgi:signal transduction histidine kinase
MNAVRSGVPTGAVRMRSQLNNDDRIIAFRRVGNYDAYVSAGYPMSAIWMAWGKHVLLLGAASWLPSLALCFMLVVSMRRLTAEEATWKQLIEEARARAALEKAQRETQRLETLGNLVGAVAHDFNNLLMSISGHAQIGMRSPVGTDRELNAIMRAVKTGQALTRRLLSVARKQPLLEQRLEFSASDYDFSLIKATLGDSIALTVSVASDAWPICVDAAELEMALLNVALNARHAMPDGGQFTLVMENIAIASNAGSALAGDYLQITMKDTGAGMSPEVLSKAFEPFYSTKLPGQGTGLGLPQCRAFCERSGGAIMLRSVEGTGTEVTFYLPHAAHAQEPDQVAERTPPQASGVCRILLVEDDATVAEAEQVLLEILGHTVRHVADAVQALDLLQQDDDFDVVLSDIQMPGGISGIDLAERLRIDKPDLPVVLVTGYTGDLTRLQATGVAVFTKPFDIAALHNHIVGIARSPSSANT